MRALRAYVARNGRGGEPRRGREPAMARRPRPMLSILTAGIAIAVAAAGLQAGGTAQAKPPTKPTKVVIILVDALSKEIVDKYDMDNVQALMSDYVDTPKGYLGHTGAVTVVTHNVLTSGLLPKHMGWTTEGYRDVEKVLPNDTSTRTKGPTSAKSSTSPATSARPDLRAAGALRLPTAGRLPQRHRLGLHRQPEGLRRLRVRRRRLDVDHHLRQRDLPGSGDRARARPHLRQPARSDRRQRSVVHHR